MASPRVQEYLNTQRNAASGKIADDWGKLEELYSQSLWHPLMQHLKSYVRDSAFRKDLDMIKLYESFIKDFEHRVNPYTLMEIMVTIANSLTDPVRSIDFLRNAKNLVVKTNEQAVILCLTAIANLKLGDKPNPASPCKQIKEVRALLEEAETKLNKLDGVTPVHAEYYKVSSGYLREMGQYGKYYREALRYLGCTDLSNMSADDLQTQALCLGLAALLGDDVYNFGELLAHPVLQSLNNDNCRWLKDLLFAFNRGDLQALHDLRPQWIKIDDLAKRENHLNAKIRLLCLMEMSFARDAKSRNITFDEMSKEARIAKDEVEILVMKAMSKGLVRGTIDQVNSVVAITWVQPRVLDMTQMEAMQGRMSAWANDVTEMATLVNNRGHEILTM